ncbi:hypothetical protein QQ045_010025 [Rhodiola kirilowii]
MAHTTLIDRYGEFASQPRSPPQTNDWNVNKKDVALQGKIIKEVIKEGASKEGELNNNVEEAEISIDSFNNLTISATTVEGEVTLYETVE